MDIKEEEAYDKIIKVIASCNTKIQIQVAIKMARLFKNQVSDNNSGLSNILFGKLYQKMLKVESHEI